MIKIINNRIKERLNNQDGSVLLFVLILLVIIVPMLLFATFELPHLVSHHRKLKNTIDNATASAASRIIESQLHYGIIEIDPTLALQTAKRIIAHDYHLDETTLKPKSGSPLRQAPILDIRVVNSPPASGTTIKFPVETVTVKNTSVAIYIQLHPKPVFFNLFQPTIHHVASTQAQF